MAKSGERVSGGNERDCECVTVSERGLRVTLRLKLVYPNISIKNILERLVHCVH